jgi:hypothetical protein
MGGWWMDGNEWGGRAEQSSEAEKYLLASYAGAVRAALESQPLTCLFSVATTKHCSSPLSDLQHQSL